MADGSEPKAEPRSLVGAITARMRERIFQGEPDARLGSLPDLAAEFGVGIVTIQQAARILEHEGLLKVRRGPNGGYYGRRPDEAALERALGTYMRLHPDSLDEAFDITSLLFIELCGTAAGKVDPAGRADLARIADAIAACRTVEALMAAEYQLQERLFRMVDRPIFELLTRVTIRFAAAADAAGQHRGAEGIARWAAGRLRIVAAIRNGDEELARFEANRSNRRDVLASISATRGQ